MKKKERKIWDSLATHQRANKKRNVEICTKHNNKWEENKHKHGGRKMLENSPSQFFCLSLLRMMRKGVDEFNETHEKKK